jgi:hypothetical protein
MTNALVIGLYPTAPTDGSTFEKYLEGLTVTAYDLDFDDPTPVSAMSAQPPNLIGEAKYDPGHSDNSIFQLSIEEPQNIYLPAAAAEAVIELPASIDPKFVSPQSLVNVVLDIARNGASLVDHSMNYDVQVFATPTVDQNTRLTQASLYLALPDPQFDSGDYLIPPSDGTPTPYQILDKAVRAILAEDPGGSLPDVTNLTPNDCLHIARELVSNRTARPLPAPLVGTSNGGGTPDLAQLYTSAPIGSGTDMDRLKFEGALGGYYNQLDGDAARMAGFVYAWSAAQKCQQLSNAALNAAITLPVRLKTASTAGQQTEATLILGN